MKDYYEVLGVPKDATHEIIRAAYRALAKAFHPDAFNADRAFAEAKMKDINAAFEVIGDHDRRREYDENVVTNFRETLDSSGKWKRACQFFPFLSTLDQDLAVVSIELSALFRSQLLESKAFSDAEALRNQLIFEFAKKQFGHQEEMRKAGITALRMGRRSFALAINEACSLIGGDNPAVILKRLALDYRDDATIIYSACGLDRYLPMTLDHSIAPGLYRIGDRLQFRVLPDASVMVFYEYGRALTNYRHIPSLRGLLSAYQENDTSIESINNDD